MVTNCEFCAFYVYDDVAMRNVMSIWMKMKWQDF